MAEVFHAEAVERRFDKPIVLKRMLPHLAGNRSFVEMFVDEARLSTRLEHPNIVQVLDFEATDRGLFLVMELVDGPDLLSIIKRCAKLGRRFPEELAVYVACHTLEALDYAHGAAAHGKPLDIVHRDVSPSNILVTRRGHVKLADFGIARASERQQQTASGTLKGKYGYMSPEQVRGAELDGRSDVFSLGICLAEMLMGRRLFTAPGELEILLMVRRGDLSRLDKYGQHISPQLLGILRRALEPDRDKRYATAGACRDALADWLTTTERRTGASHLAQLIAELEKDGEPLCVRGEAPSSATSATTLSGPDTKLARLELKKSAAVGRQVFALGAVQPHQAQAPTAVDVDVGLAPYEGGATTIDAGRSRPPRARSVADELDLRSGAIEDVPVLEILCEIARRQLTGVLVVKRGGRFKEAFFRDGHPDFVRSNIPEERFGQYLVRRRVLTAKQLGRALAAMPHFGGRLGQALVSLDLLRPVDAVRLLTDQVEHKLVELCSWTSGRFFFREHVTNPWPALELRLNTLAVVGRCVEETPTETLVAWAKRYRDRKPMIDLDAAAAIGVGPTLAERLEWIAEGAITLADAIKRLPTAAERHSFLAAAYVLWRCNILSLPRRRPDSSVETMHIPETGERRRYPRVEMHLPGTLRHQGGPQDDDGAMHVTIWCATCEGLGVELDAGTFGSVQRGDIVVLRFLAGTRRLELTGRVRWRREEPDGCVHAGIKLEPALCTAAMRETYAAWIVALLHAA